MSRPFRIFLPPLTVAALAHLVLGWRSAQADAGAHRWSANGLDWLALERFSLWTGWNGVLLAGGVAGLLAMLIEVRAGEDGVLRKLAGILANPVVCLLAVAAAQFGPRLLAQQTRPDAPAGAPNVLFVLVDTWRADHAGFLGYERPVTPKLDALSREGVVFEQAISQAPWTKPAVATLFTGTVPSTHGAVSNPIQGRAVRGVNLAKSSTTFLELLRGHGWETAAWSSNPNVVPQRGFAQGAGSFHDAFNDPARTETFDPGRSEHQVERVRAWLAAHADGPRPFAAYLHVMDPHYPYEAPEPFAGTFDTSGLDFNLTGSVCDAYYEGERDVSEVTPEMLQRVVDIYDEEILCMDHHVGGLIEEVLREHPDTVVVLVSDHGEEFLEHGQFGHGIGLWDTLVHVPLVVWAPTLEPARVTTQVPLLDVPPTLLELVGLASKAPRDYQGASLMPVVLGAEATHRLAPLESGGDGRPSWQYRGLRDGATKVVVRETDLPERPAPPLHAWDRDLTAPVPFVFDLRADPTESAGPVAPDDPRVGAALQTLRDNGWYLSPADLMSGMRAQRVDLGGDVDRLRDLGYARRRGSRRGALSRTLRSSTRQRDPGGEAYGIVRLALVLGRFVARGLQRRQSASNSAADSSSIASKKFRHLSFRLNRRPRS